MKVLGINGSHRKGSTLKLLEVAFNEIDEKIEKEIISLSDYEIGYCKLCGACKKNGGICVLKDGFQEISEKMKSADFIIIGSPVYFGSVSGKLKSLFDRSRALRVNWELKNKFCGGIAVGATIHGGQEHTLQAIHSWALIHGMVVIGDTSPTAHFGGAAVAKQKDENFEFNPEGVETVKSLGRHINEIAAMLK
ncbi:flavodoxin family protein [Desulfurobacterium atlanticum]|uniref:Multimeric flavodoxin WrbA n=1 Tax=Desulfurobacterium atlanticum TaxID=240169 RepID=A0A238Y572_9BACT|nr:flavodoxin family protein [Desulfurobacterium atlanticum]SNR65724.1 Multimeric flavodoxin WrbA [Desulfurobacterium atlanticum]